MVTAFGKLEAASGACHVSVLPAIWVISDVFSRSAVNSMMGTGWRYESPTSGFKPDLANSLAIHWIATSLPRSSERRPSRASEERKVRSALRRTAWIDSKPSAMRERVGVWAQARAVMRKRVVFRIGLMAHWESRHDGVGHARIGECGAVAGLLAGGGQQARGQRLAPFVGQRRDVAED